MLPVYRSELSAKRRKPYFVISDVIGDAVHPVADAGSSVMLIRHCAANSYV